MLRNKGVVLVSIFLSLSIFSVIKALAKESVSVLYVPLIGLTTVSTPPNLPTGPGQITLKYAVKSFLREIPLTDIKVTDELCNPVKFVTGDDNKNEKLDYEETWRFSCIVRLNESSISTATVTGMANNIQATHRATATIMVGSDELPPLISIVNTSKIRSPIPWIKNGEEVNFTYKVNNPGSVPLNDVEVTDDICGPITGRLGDTNGNELLDTNEVWIYYCKNFLKQTTINTAKVTAKADGLKASAETSLKVEVNKNPDEKGKSWLLMGALLISILFLRQMRAGKGNIKSAKRK